ncbi:MAG: hypothetical protein IJ137_05835 [Eubacterium sp.]|nr:hypothetical protein [Eubacterium sp.]
MNYELMAKLIQRKNYLEQIIREKQEAIENSPPGRLRISRSHGRTQCFYRSDPSDKHGKYICKEERALASKIAQKDYDIRVLKSAREELHNINELLILYEQGSIEAVYEQLSEPRQKLINPIVLSDNEYADRWQNNPYQKKAHLKDTPEYSTAKGEHVRSKSEIIIADTLYRRNIPYKYECPLVLAKVGTIHPDFTLLNVRLRKEYYWEHLGMMDSPQYAEAALDRINQYERHGIFPGDNLIITHETHNTPFQTAIIDDLISLYLL